MIAGHDYFGFLHFEPEVVAFAGAFADAGENGNAAVLHGYVVDELLNEHRLAHAGAAEEADLAAFQVRLHEIDDLDAGLEHFQSGGLIFERRSGAVNLIALLGFHGAEAVNRLAENIQHPAQSFAADGNGNSLAEIFGLHSADEAFGGLHRDAADTAFAEMLLHFADEVDGVRRIEAFAGDAHGVVDGGQVVFGEFDVDDWADDLNDASDIVIVLWHF